MTNTTIPKLLGIARIIYKEIVEGDRRKFEARSNDAETGGGARDLRFSPYTKFKSVFERMLPTKNSHGICVGRFHWIEEGIEKSGDAFFHPPTKARPTEGRIANIDKYLPKQDLPQPGQGKVILLLIQQTDATVWPRFTTDRSLESGAWDIRVSELILNCLRATRREGISPAGFIDFETNEVFCNGT